jgi:hypothetical protein
MLIWDDPVGAIKFLLDFTFFLILLSIYVGIIAGILYTICKVFDKYYPLKSREK